MSYETELYNFLCEVEKKYYAYYEEFIKQLDKAETQAEFEKIYDGITKRFEFYVQEFAKNGVIKLPCKIGDEVWCIRTYNGHKSHAQKGKVTEMYFADDMRLVIHIKHIGRGFWGDRIFATEKEALENILKEGESNA